MTKLPSKKPASRGVAGLTTTAPRLLLAALLLAGIGTAEADDWQIQKTPTKERLRGISVVSARVAWASGNRGTVLRTIDGGATWNLRTIPDTKGLDFRDLHAVSEQAAIVLSIGPGEQSRIYTTADGGDHWALRLRLEDQRGFLDAIAFWDARHGIALGDPIGGRFLILKTEDGGTTWVRPDASAMPPALEGEGAFAASGTCVATAGDRDAWFGTGGVKVARVFRSSDRGATWTVHETPIAAGQSSSGIFSLAFRDRFHGVAVGGDYQQPERGGRIAARTTNGGRTWELATGQGPRAYRSAVAYLSDASKPTLIATGPSGSDFSTDDGRSWAPLSGRGTHAVAAAGPASAWAVGEAGLIALLKLE